MVKTLFCVEKLIMYHENKFCRLNLIFRDRKFLYEQGWSAVEVKPRGRVLHVYEVFFREQLELNRVRIKLILTQMMSSSCICNSCTIHVQLRNLSCNYV